MDLSDRPAPAQDVLLAAFLDEVAAVGERQLDSTRFALRLTAEELAEFRLRLRALFDDYRRRPPAADAERWSLYVGMHPEPSRVVPGDDDTVDDNTSPAPLGGACHPGPDDEHC